MKKLALLVALLGHAQGARAQLTERVSVGTGGVQANFGADAPFPGNLVSQDGRFVVFMSPSTTLVSGDTNSTWDIFVRDRFLGMTERVSVDSSGQESNGPSGLYGLCISEDGRYVVFYSTATNLVAGDTNGCGDLFLRDRLLNTTERISVDSSGAQANAFSFYPAISADGRFVVFESPATNLVSGDTNGAWDVFIRDRQSGTTDRVSMGIGGAEGNGGSGAIASISPDGRLVGFASDATNLVAGDLNNATDAFVLDRSTGQMDLVSLSSGGAQGNGMSVQVALSADGRFAAFASAASNLVFGDTNAYLDVFVRDRVQGTTERVSVSNAGLQGNADSRLGRLSADGRFVSFASGASTLVAGDTGWTDIFVRDRQLGTTERLSVTPAGSQANGQSDMPSISSNGRFIMYRSLAPDIVAGDTNASTDIFVHDRNASGFLGFCDPGINNVIACPCNNSPAGLGRGCDNSSFTGGATLTAAGIAYLANDSLSFSTGGEKPSATSLLLQGNALNQIGLAFGQGVRCVGGTLKRMYVKTAVNGSITAPDLGAGDPTVSARSAQLGVQIQVGQPLYYLVYYRDPVVRGGCSALSTFNCTQSGSVTYWP